MAFNFYGVCTSSQWEVFKNFTQIQVMDLRLRKRWLEKEILRVGVFITEYDGSTPVSFTVTPPNSYAAKLMSAYRILGGTPEQDMLLRTRDLPVYLLRGSPVKIGQDGLPVGGYSDVYSNGRRCRGNQRFDRDLGFRVERLKSWQLEAIKAKREKLEFKIKRSLDYSDQIQQEINYIDGLLNSVTGSVEDQVLQVELEMAAPYTATTVSNKNDLWGLDIGIVADKTLPSSEELTQEGAQRGGVDQGVE
jgi:hypothetical protein